MVFLAFTCLFSCSFLQAKSHEWYLEGETWHEQLKIMEIPSPEKNWERIGDQLWDEKAYIEARLRYKKIKMTNLLQKKRMIYGALKLGLPSVTEELRLFYNENPPSKDLEEIGQFFLFQEFNENIFLNYEGLGEILTYYLALHFWINKKDDLLEKILNNSTYMHSSHRFLYLKFLLNPGLNWEKTHTSLDEKIYKIQKLLCLEKTFTKALLESKELLSDPKFGNYISGKLISIALEENSKILGNFSYLFRYEPWSHLKFLFDENWESISENLQKSKNDYRTVKKMKEPLTDDDLSLIKKYLPTFSDDRIIHRPSKPHYLEQIKNFEEKTHWPLEEKRIIFMEKQIQKLFKIYGALLSYKENHDWEKACNLFFEKQISNLSSFNLILERYEFLLKNLASMSLLWEKYLPHLGEPGEYTVFLWSEMIKTLKKSQKRILLQKKEEEEILQQLKNFSFPHENSNEWENNKKTILKKIKNIIFFYNSLKAYLSSPRKEKSLKEWAKPWMDIWLEESFPKRKDFLVEL